MMEPNQEHLILKNEVEELNKLPAFVESVCEKAGIDIMLVASLNLAVEEAVTNVILYAYPKEAEGLADLDTT